jgi:hypothetical protein
MSTHDYDVTSFEKRLPRKKAPENFAFITTHLVMEVCFRMKRYHLCEAEKKASSGSAR